MGHKIAEAIIENGQLQYIEKALPAGRIRVHIIYDSVEETLPETEMSRIVREASGLYTNIDVDAESRKLRESWERDVLK